jgi:endoglucanase
MIVGTGKLSRTVLLALVWALAIAAVALIACGETVREGDVPPASTRVASFTATPGEVHAVTPTAAPTTGAALLGRGVNLGNALEAPREGEWGLVLEEAYFDLIADAGFDSVRVPIRWHAYAATEPPYTLSDTILERVDWVIEQALARDLSVVINVHHYQALIDDTFGQRERFLAIWRQIGERYAGADERLFFEVLNEPNGALDGASWNRLLAETLGVIRESNPERWVIAGPGLWNGYRGLDALQLPADDRRLIVTYHYYDPFHFTHQGAEWAEGSAAWMGTTWEGTSQEVAEIRAAFDRVARWADEDDRPVYLGEFGAYSKADMASRARWTAQIVQEAEARDFGWAYWEFGSGFGAYDRTTRAWRPELLQALLSGD